MADYQNRRSQHKQHNQVPFNNDRELYRRKFYRLPLISFLMMIAAGAVVGLLVH